MKLKVPTLSQRLEYKEELQNKKDAQWRFPDKANDYLGIEPPKTIAYKTPRKLFDFGIVCCDTCGYLQNVERTYCKRCDGFIQTTIQENDSENQNEE
jgi:hypothetical protein